jgi:anti-sigma B factor antagonist
MFKVTFTDSGPIQLSGRLDASSAEEAGTEFGKINESVTLDFKDLEYISSAGLGVLFAAQKRLKESGHGLKLINMNSHIRDVFKFARFDLVFEIE